MSDVASRPSQKYPFIDYDYRSPVVDGLYFTGTIAHSLDFRQSAGGFIHGFRYSGNKILNTYGRCFVASGKLQPIVIVFFQYFVTARVLSKILNWRYHQERWPSEILPLSNLTTAIIRRVNEASGLYQMFAYLGDVILLGKLVSFLKNLILLIPFYVSLFMKRVDHLSSVVCFCGISIMPHCQYEICSLCIATCSNLQRWIV